MPPPEVVDSDGRAVAVPPGPSSLAPLVRMTIHAVVIGAALAFIAVAATVTDLADSTSNLIGMLALAALGLPWSGIYVWWPFRELAELGEAALFASFALLNLALHGCYWITRLRGGSRP